MDVEKAHAYIRSLADGVDPVTGWVLPADHTCQQPDVIRALMAASDMLAREAKREQRLKRARLTLPANIGRAWTVEEDGALLKRFRTGSGIDAIAGMHGRTSRAIRLRLEKLGQMAPAVGEPADGVRPDRLQTAPRSYS